MVFHFYVRFRPSEFFCFIAFTVKLFTASDFVTKLTGQSGITLSILYAYIWAKDLNFC